MGLETLPNGVDGERLEVEGEIVGRFVVTGFFVVAGFVAIS